MKKKKTETEKAGAKFRLVKFAELPVKLKGGGTGSAHAVLGELLKKGFVQEEDVADVELHEYVLNEEGEIFGVGVFLDHFDEAGNPAEWQGPRDVLLWQAMTCNVEGLGAAAVKETAEGAESAEGAGSADLRALCGETPGEAARSGAVMLNRALLLPWRDQPRKNFDQAFVEQLAGVMKARGASPAFPLLVRPAGNSFEIADGERRWRAAGIAGIEELPCVVEALSDAEMLELAMISSIHKKELSPMEEANGLRRMLELKGENGEPLHTVESIAESLGVVPATVQWKLGLTRLAGSPVGAALDAGDITPQHARLIAQVPTQATRLQVLEMVLKPVICPAPMPVVELRRQLTQNFVRELRGAPFALEDAALVPVEMERGERVAGGACSDCPWNVASEGSRKMSMCMSPECYRKKEAAVHERWVAAKLAEGKKALSKAENEKVFAQDGVKLSVTTEYVDLDEKPDKADLGAKSDDLPAWGKLVKGAGVPVVVALDAKGRERSLVERKLAVEAVEQIDRALPAEKQMLEGSAKVKKAPLNDVSEKERVLAEKKAREAEERLEAAELAAIVTAARLPFAKLTSGWLGMALTVLAYRVDEGEIARICKRRGWASTPKAEEGADTDLLLDRADSLPEHDGVSLLTELLLAASSEDFVGDWAAALGVDLKKVRKDEQAAMKAEAKSEKSSKAAKGLVEWAEEPAAWKWNEAGVCENPVVGTLDLGDKITAQVKVARNEKGWAYGFEFATPNAMSGAPVSSNGTHYDTRELAERTALLALKGYCEGVDMLAVEKIAAFLKGAK